MKTKYPKVKIKFPIRIPRKPPMMVEVIAWAESIVGPDAYVGMYEPEVEEFQISEKSIKAVTLFSRKPVVMSTFLRKQLVERITGPYDEHIAPWIEQGILDAYSELELAQERKSMTAWKKKHPGKEYPG